MSKKTPAGEQLPPQIVTDPTTLRVAELARLKRNTTTGPGGKERAGDTVDLGTEIVRDSRGRRIAEAEQGQIAEQTLEKAVGRPSLTGAGQRSPRVSFRVSAETRQLAEQRAAAEGKTVSELARQALERYVRTPPPDR